MALYPSNRILPLLCLNRRTRPKHTIPILSILFLSCGQAASEDHACPCAELTLAPLLGLAMISVVIVIVVIVVDELGGGAPGTSETSGHNRATRTTCVRCAPYIVPSAVRP